MWDIAVKQLKQRLVEYGVDPEQAGIIPNLMLRRFAQNGRSQYLFVSANLYQEITDSLRENRHWIHRADRKVVAATLMALESFIDPEKAHTTEEARDIVKRIDTAPEASWQKFVDGFHHDQVLMQDPSLAGVVEILGGTGNGLAYLFTNGATLLLHAGDTPDVRLRTLVTRSLEAFSRMRPPTSQTVYAQRDIFANYGLPPPPSHAETVALAQKLNIILDNADNQELASQLKPGSEFYNSLSSLLFFLTAYGRPGVAKTANEALMLLPTALFEVRAQAPLGRPTVHFPQIDGKNRDEVLKFLKESLNVPIQTEKQANAVWDFWQEAWNDPNLTATSATWDVDDTLTIFRSGPEGKFGSAWGWTKGIETVRLREVVLQLAAVALRDKTPIPITTTCSASRFADLVNQPGLAPLKFISTLRLPQDPLVTVEEIRTAPNIQIYEGAIEKNLGQLRPLTNEEQADVFIRALLRQAVTTVSGFPKNRGIAASGTDKRADILVDNKRKNLRTFIDSGAPAAILVPDPGHRVAQLDKPVPNIWGTLRSVHIAIASGTVKPGKGQLFGAYRDTHYRETDFPPMQATIDHLHWLPKVFSSWVAYWLKSAKHRVGFRYLSKVGRRLVAWANQPIHLLVEPETPALLPPPAPPISIFPENGDPLTEAEMKTRFPQLDPQVLQANKIAQLFDWSKPLLGLSLADLELVKLRGVDIIVEAIEKGGALEGYPNAPEMPYALILLFQIQASLTSTSFNGYDALALYAALKKRKITGARLQLVAEMLNDRRESGHAPVSLDTLLAPASTEKRRLTKPGPAEDLEYTKADNIDKRYIARFFPNLDLSALVNNPVAVLLELNRKLFSFRRSDLILLRRYAGESAKTLLTQLRILQKPFSDIAYEMADEIDRLDGYDRLALYMALIRELFDEKKATAFFQAYLNDAITSPPKGPVILVDLLSPLPKTEEAIARSMKNTRGPMPPPPVSRGEEQGALARRTGELAVTVQPASTDSPKPGAGKGPSTAHLGTQIMAGGGSELFNGTGALKIGVLTLTEAAPLLDTDLADEETDTPKGHVVGLNAWKRTHPWAAAYRTVAHAPTPGTTARVLSIR